MQDESPPPLRPMELLVAQAAYGLVAIVFSWPLALHLGTHVPSSTHDLSQADAYLTIWIHSWNAQVLVENPAGLFHANAFHPAPYALAFSEHMLGYFPLFAPTWWLTGNPLLAVNVMALLALSLRALSLYALARLWVPPGAAFVGGMLYGFHQGLRLEILHTHLFAAYGLPLAILFTERWLRTGRVRHVFGLGGSLVVQAASSLYLGFAIFLGYAAYLPLALWSHRSILQPRALVGIVVGGLMAVVPIAGLSVPYLWLKAIGLIPDFHEVGHLPTGLLPMARVAGLVRGLGAAGVGLVGYGLAALAFFPPWRGRSRPLAIVGVLVAVGILAAFGPDIPVGDGALWSPYQWLASFLPGLETVRVPTRFIIIAHLGFCLAAALGGGRVLAWGDGRRWVAASVVAVGFIAVLPREPLSLVAPPLGARTPEAYRWLAENGAGRPLLELPVPKALGAARRMLISTQHRLPIIDGYSGYPSPSAAFLHRIASDLHSPGRLVELVDHVDVGWILVHLGELAPADRGLWKHRPMPDGLRLIGVWDSDLLFEVKAQPLDPSRRDRLLSSEVTLEGRPLVPIDGPCPGRIEIVGPIRVAPRGQGIRVPLRIENEGERWWPGNGIVPRNLVYLTACYRPEGGAACIFKRWRPLGVDVGPGTAEELDVIFFRPRAVGRYDVTIALEQRKVGSLAECGVAPITAAITIPPRP